MECNHDKQMDNINFTDTDEENSDLQSDMELIENRVSNATINATKSLFNITVANLDDQQTDANLKNYEKRLDQEMIEWKSLICEMYTNLKKSKEKHPIVDKTILSKDKLEYLDKAPCLQRFLQDSVEFRQKAHIFMEFDYAEINDMINNLYDLVERQTNLIKSNIISENLADIAKKK